MKKLKTLVEWRRFFIAVLVYLALLVFLGVSWCILVIVVVASGRDAAQQSVLDAVSHGGGWLIGLIPAAVSTVYLVRSISSAYWKHGCFLASTMAAISAVFIFIEPEHEILWTDAAYVGANVVVVLATCFFVIRFTRSR